MHLQSQHPRYHVFIDHRKSSLPVNYRYSMNNVEDIEQRNIERERLFKRDIQSLLDFLDEPKEEREDSYRELLTILQSLYEAPYRMYKQYHIPKRRKGQFRTICEPISSLKKWQRKIATKLNEVFEPSVHVQAFVPKRSIFSNAIFHAKHTPNEILSIDIRDFFASLTCYHIAPTLRRIVKTDELLRIILFLTTKQNLVPAKFTPIHITRISNLVREIRVRGRFFGRFSLSNVELLIHLISKSGLRAVEINSNSQKELLVKAICDSVKTDIQARERGRISIQTILSSERNQLYWKVHEELLQREPYIWTSIQFKTLLLVGVAFGLEPFDECFPLSSKSADMVLELLRLLSVEDELPEEVTDRLPHCMPIHNIQLSNDETAMATSVHKSSRLYTGNHNFSKTLLHENLYSLPQGAPTSPILSNIAMIEFDQEMSSLAKTYDLAYTRYADDLVFSGNKMPMKMHRTTARKLQDYGLLLNRQKTKRRSLHQQQMVTGLIINPQEQNSKIDLDSIPDRLEDVSKEELSAIQKSRIVRVPKQYVKQLRKEMYCYNKIPPSQKHKQEKDSPLQIEKIQGKLSFIHSVDPEMANRLRNKYWIFPKKYIDLSADSEINDE